MFRFLFSVLVFMVLMGCASRTKVVSALTPVEPSLEGPPKFCADSSMVFRPEKGTYQFGLDPVETRKLVLESRAFRQKLVSVDPSMRDARYQIYRLENSAVLQLVAQAETLEDALRVCQALVRTAIAGITPDENGGGTREWLANQREQVEREKQKAEQELTSFLQTHNMSVLDPTEQLALLREQFVGLKKEQARTSDKKRSVQLAKRLTDLEAKITDMVYLEVTYNHLKRTVEQHEQILGSLREHETEAILQRLTESSLNVLESCAPTSCAGVAAPR